MIRRRTPPLIAGSLVLGIFLAACANVPASEGSSSEGSGGGPPPQWDNLLAGSGFEVPGVMQASSYLSFTPTVPEFAAPDKVVVGGADSLTKATTVAMRFTTDAYGMFWLVEQESQTDQAELEALASSCDPDRGCEGTWSLTKLDDGTVALSIVGAPANSIVWLRGDIRFDVVGPSSSFEASSASAVANSVVRAG